MEYYNIDGGKEFERNFIDGKKVGHGKEYSNNNLIFEGDYSNDKRNGKGKEYNNSGILSFEGEYLNGKRNGKGKEYKAIIIDVNEHGNNNV